jgi:hypothetical protein
MITNEAMSQDLRPTETFFIKPRVGVSSYLGDNEKSPTNFNFDMYKIDGKLPYNIAIEFGYQFSVPFSVSAAFQLGNYPIITQFGEEEGSEKGINDDPTTRNSVQVFGRYTVANARSKVAPYINFGVAYSFGTTAQQVNLVRTGQEKKEGAFGPLVGVGLDFALNDRTSFFLEAQSSISLNDTALDANDTKGLGLGAAPTERSTRPEGAGSPVSDGTNLVEGRSCRKTPPVPRFFETL